MQLKEAKTLALLDNVHAVKCIAWVPECSSNGNKLTHEDGTLKGKYIVKYEEHHQDGPTVLRDVKVSNDWAEKNFSVVALA